MKYYGGIEAGGTKIICIIGSGYDQIDSEIRMLTTSPEETLGKVIEFYKNWQLGSGERLSGIGVACFGPLDLNRSSESYGSITYTTKPGWDNTDIVNSLMDALDIRVVIDTDVNGAALGEYKWGAGKGLDIVYLTIGTGIGGGAIIHGQPVHGMIHPEMGHIKIPHNMNDDPFEGVCQFHGDCFEGLASGSALEKRWDKKGEDISKNHIAWELEANYIALGLQNIICTLSPQKIILGGGVMKQQHLFPMIRTKLRNNLADYINAAEIIEDNEEYIAPPGLGDHSGVLGALAMAME
ncbi:MAG: ROK family protein [Anaerolineaceae bacterium]|nr:ROK family protein [Anaerolineaceae bacterium]